MIYFLRLLRPINLLVIALTMYSVNEYYWVNHEFSAIANEKLIKPDFYLKCDYNFFFLVFSTVLIAAAGNIINDYFDRKADRINKPNRLIVGKYIKPRVAILAHLGFNLLALLIGLYLTYQWNSWIYFFIHFFTISCLWFYSSYFKRKPFSGNFLVAGLTALVPLLAAFVRIHSVRFSNLDQVSTVSKLEMNRIHSAYFTNIIDWMEKLNFNFGGILLLSFTALIANLAREIIKDMEDVEGDKLISARTLPMIWGFKKTINIINIGLIGLVLLYSAIYFYHRSESFMNDVVVLFPVFVAVSLIAVATIPLRFAKTRKQLKRVDLMLKISFACAILLPFYWYLFV